MNYYEIVRKLIGNINPIGQTNQDDERFENLEELTSLLELLITDIKDMAIRNSHSHEFSVKRAADYARKFINGLSELK